MSEQVTASLIEEAQEIAESLESGEDQLYSIVSGLTSAINSAGNNGELADVLQNAFEEVEYVISDLQSIIETDLSEFREEDEEEDKSKVETTTAKSSSTSDNQSISELVENAEYAISSLDDLISQLTAHRDDLKDHVSDMNSEEDAEELRTCMIEVNAEINLDNNVSDHLAFAENWQFEPEEEEDDDEDQDEEEDDEEEEEEDKED